MIIFSVVVMSCAAAAIFTSFRICKQRLAKQEQIDEATRNANQLLQIKNEELEDKHNYLQTTIAALQEKQRRLEIKNAEIKAETQQMTSAADSYFNLLEITYCTKEKEFDAKVDTLRQAYKNALQQEQHKFQQAFEHYVDNLDDSYSQTEKQYDAQINEIQASIQKHKEELDKIQSSYAAAIEARLREEEKERELDFYCLHLTPAEQSTIALIEELKPRLPEPRVLCMLVWQTFYQKQAGTLCANVLKKTTSVCGIYKITDKKTGQCYIGQATDVRKRWLEHIKAGLGIDTPAQNKLYRAMAQEGITNFTFELLEECPKEQLNEKEKFYINLYLAKEFGFNSQAGNG